MKQSLIGPWEAIGRSVFEFNTTTCKGYRVRVAQVDKAQGPESGPKLAQLIAQAPALAYALEALCACSDAALPHWRAHAQRILSTLPPELLP